MKPVESELRAIKDRIAGALGEIEDAAPDAVRKANLLRLSEAARELHRCADEVQNLLMRIRTR